MTVVCGRMRQITAQARAEWRMTNEPSRDQASPLTPRFIPFVIRHPPFVIFLTHRPHRPNSTTPIVMTTHRLGKIARLPYFIRLKLNERLADNEPAQALANWLNAQPEVEEVLAKQFGGRPISPQNISAWKQGGYRDWERFQESRLQARTFLEEADELVSDLFDPNEEGEAFGSFLDRLGDRMALSLMQLFREVELRESGPERTRDLLHIARELSRLRRVDHERQRTAIAQKQRYDEEVKQIKWEQAGDAVREMIEKQRLKSQVTQYRARLLFGLAEETLKPAEEKEIREFFLRNAERIRECGLPGFPEGEELEQLLEEIRASKEEKAAEEESEDEEDEENGDEPTDEETAEVEAVEADDADEDARNTKAAEPAAPAKPEAATEEIKASQASTSLHQASNFSPELERL